LRKQAEQQLTVLSEDIEALCRRYVEYAADDCTARVNGLAEELEVVGRDLLTQVPKDCIRDTTELADKTAEEETMRFERLGEQEEESLNTIY
jgi:hypothetical protein